jgi:DNA-binding transcriptional ArsR family regulator
VAADLSPIFAALADPTRRRIFERLSKRPLTVVKIAAGLPVSRPAVSQHLKVLSDSGLVTGEQHGRCRVYRIEPKAIQAARDYLDRMWDDALIAFKNLVEQEDEHDRQRTRT